MTTHTSRQISVITKDSEAWTDIAVPAVVDGEFDGVLCGYHLAMIRPDPGQLDSRFLARAFQAVGIREQFHIEAKGITRFGLSGDGVASAQFPLPPVSEQGAIADFLDRETAKIDRLIANKTRLITLLEEQVSAITETQLATQAGVEVPLKRFVDLLPGFAFSSDSFLHSPEDGVRLLRGVNV